MKKFISQAGLFLAVTIIALLASIPAMLSCEDGAMQESIDNAKYEIMIPMGGNYLIYYTDEYLIQGEQIILTDYVSQLYIKTKVTGKKILLPLGSAIIAER